MGLVSGNRLNRFWQKGVKPIKDAIGVLSALSTVDKSTLVAAVNELADGKFDAAKLVASTTITEPGFAMDGKTASEAIAELYSKKLKILTKNLKIEHPAGYFTYDYQPPDVEGDVICVIPALLAYQHTNQRPTWAYTGRQFWINCYVAGYVVFDVYVFYK